MQLTKSNYFLQWKGKESGPFTAEEIKSKLDSNEIGLLYNVRDESGAVCILEEFLATVKSRKIAEQQREQERREEQDRERIQAEYEEKLAVEQSKQQDLQKRLREAEGKMVPVYPSHPSVPAAPRELYYQSVGNEASNRTSGMAVTALIMGLLNFVPFVNFVSWILAIIFGHIALSQINRNPHLKGYGMALAGLIITYVLLGAGVIFLILFVALKGGRI